jgi:hypothetical protein
MLSTLFSYSLITPDSVIFPLNNQSTCVLNSCDGFGMAPSHRLRERSSQQHGETDLGFRLDPRLIALHLSFRATSPTDYYARRSALMGVFRPSNRPYQIKVAVPNGPGAPLERSIDCYMHKALTFDTTKRKALVQDFDVELVAPDPTFYDPTLRQVATTLDFDVSQKNASIANAGTWLTYPVITITGPIANPRVYNSSTLELLEMAYSLPAGDAITIDTRFGRKTVRNAAGASLIACLTAASDLAAFHLDHELPGGASNVLQLSGTFQAGQSATVTIQYYERFIGI